MAYCQSWQQDVHLYHSFQRVIDSPNKLIDRGNSWDILLHSVQLNIVVKTTTG